MVTRTDRPIDSARTTRARSEADATTNLPATLPPALRATAAPRTTAATMTATSPAGSDVCARTASAAPKAMRAKPNRRVPAYPPELLRK